MANLQDAANALAINKCQTGVRETSLSHTKQRTVCLRGGIRTMMITGDFHHTAIAVARDVGMLASDSPVVVIDAVQQSPDAAIAPSASQATSSNQHHSAMQHQQQQQQQRESCMDTTPSGMVTSAVQEPGHEQAEGLRSDSKSDMSFVNNFGQSHYHLANAAPQRQSSTKRHTPSISRSKSSLTSKSHSKSQLVASGHRSLSHLQSAMTVVQSSENSRDQLLPQGIYSAQSVQQSVDSSGRLMGRLVQPIGSALQPMGSLQSSMGSASPLLGPLQPMHSQPSALSASAVRLNSERLRSSDLGSQSLKRVHYQQPAEAERLKPALSGTGSNPNLASGPVQVTPTKRLQFTIGGMGHEQNPTEALTAMAQGQMRCAVTGEAFELLLQLPDESALYAMMQNVVVFARMKPHQKGQVMHLLGLRGLHQRCQGRQRHLPVSKHRHPCDSMHTHIQTDAVMHCGRFCPHTLAAR